MNDTKYKQGFCAWERFDKEYRLMNQMYHNMGYGKGITSDLRLALLTEVSEPLSKLLESKKLISIEKENPTRIQKISLHFHNCLLSLLFYLRKLHPA